MEDKHSAISITFPTAVDFTDVSIRSGNIIFYRRLITLTAHTNHGVCIRCHAFTNDSTRVI